MRLMPKQKHRLVILPFLKTTWSSGATQWSREELLFEALQISIIEKLISVMLVQILESQRGS